MNHHEAREHAERVRALYAAFANGNQPTLNADQISALHKLMFAGVQAGTGPEAQVTRRPRALLITAGTPRTPAAGPLREDYESGGDASHRPGPDGHPVYAIAEDGRAWSVVEAGICWPEPHNDEVARRRLAADAGPTGE